LNKGKILVSNFTLLNDLEFNKSVIIIVKDDHEATIGFILNKKSKYIISELNESCKGLDLSVYEGGPVAMDSLHFIHKNCKHFKDSIKINDDLYWGMNFKLAVELLKKDKINKNDIKFFLGYSGWEKNQLRGELDENSWLLSKNFKTKDILETSNVFWKKKINEFGEYYKIWSNSPDNPNLN
tara:strand:- start:359 stop:904 length:546 start_codon:yes stop_codon:yes gene_type:complete